jgi:hypothetical protein
MDGSNRKGKQTKKNKINTNWKEKVSESSKMRIKGIRNVCEKKSIGSIGRKERHKKTYRKGKNHACTRENMTNFTG